MPSGATTTASSARPGPETQRLLGGGWRFATRDDEFPVPVKQNFLLSWFRLLQSAKNGHTHWYMHLVLAFVWQQC
jgi:hypothetical protein